MASLADVAAYAQGALGKPYVWGATGPNSYDCSGLVYAAYKAAGYDVSRSTAATLGTEGTAVSLAGAVPGDVVYINEPGATDHVGIYIGGGQMIDAPHTGARVEVDPVTGYTSIRDLTGGAGGGGATSGGLTVQNAAFGIPTANTVQTIALKVGAGLIAGALIVVGLKESVSSG